MIWYFSTRLGGDNFGWAPSWKAPRFGGDHCPTKIPQIQIDIILNAMCCYAGQATYWAAYAGLSKHLTKYFLGWDCFGCNLPSSSRRTFNNHRRHALCRRGEQQRFLSGAVEMYLYLYLYLYLCQRGERSRFLPGGDDELKICSWEQKDRNNKLTAYSRHYSSWFDWL